LRCALSLARQHLPALVGLLTSEPSTSGLLVASSRHRPEKPGAASLGNNGQKDWTRLSVRLQRRGRSGFAPDSLFVGLTAVQADHQRTPIWPYHSNCPPSRQRGGVSAGGGHVPGRPPWLATRSPDTGPKQARLALCMRICVGAGAATGWNSSAGCWMRNPFNRGDQSPSGFPPEPRDRFRSRAGPEGPFGRKGRGIDVSSTSNCCYVLFVEGA